MLQHKSINFSQNGWCTQQRVDRLLHHPFARYYVLGWQHPLVDVVAVWPLEDEPQLAVQRNVLEDVCKSKEILPATSCGAICLTGNTTTAAGRMLLRLDTPVIEIINNKPTLSFQWFQS